MALISCPECGKQISDRATACPDCGCPISTAPAAPVATPAESNAEKAAKLLELAHRAKAGSDTKNAKHYYEQILLLEPGNWEAIFYAVYYEDLNCQIINIASAAYSISNCLYNTFCAIAELEDEAKMLSAAIEVISATNEAKDIFMHSADSHYRPLIATANEREAYIERLAAIRHLVVELEPAMKRAFKNHKNLIALCQEAYLDIIKFDNLTSLFSISDNFDSSVERLHERLRIEISTVNPVAGKRAELNKQIKDLEKSIDSLVVTQTPNPCCAGKGLVFFGIVFLIICLTSLGVGVPGSILTLEFIAGTALFALGLFIQRPTPSMDKINTNLALKRKRENKLRDLKEELKKLG